jgi:hypothetical protein
MSVLFALIFYIRLEDCLAAPHPVNLCTKDEKQRTLRPVNALTNKRYACRGFKGRLTNVGSLPVA